MEQIDQKKRKPRRTLGTPSYKYRNYFAVFGILAGSVLCGLWCSTPFFRTANENAKQHWFTVTQEDIDRRFTFSLMGAPRTSRTIQASLDERDRLKSEQ